MLGINEVKKLERVDILCFISVRLLNSVDWFAQLKEIEEGQWEVV